MESMPLFPRLKLAAELWLLRGRGVRVPAKLSLADLLEIVRRANEWPAPCGRLSCLLYGALTRALLEFFKASFSTFVSTNPFFVFGENPPPPPPLKANPQLCISLAACNYIFLAPVSVAAIVMLREAFEEARKAREALLAVTSATNVESEG